MAQTVEHNIVAVYPNMEDARGAMTALERAGVDAQHISLVGRPAAEAAAKTDTQQRDKNVARSIGGRAMRGWMIGAALGAVIGLVVGAILFAGLDYGNVGLGIGMAIGGGALFGGIVGALLGGETGLNINESFELTQDEVGDGNVMVSVHSPDHKDIEQADKVLRDGGTAARAPLKIRRFDSGGTARMA